MPSESEQAGATEIRKMLLVKEVYLNMEKCMN